MKSLLGRAFLSRLAGLGLLTGLFLGVGCAGTAPLSLGEAIDDLLADYAVAGSPGVAVMVLEGGQVLHSEGYGLADLAEGRPLTPSTPIRLASLSKALTAMAIVVLADEGSLDYDDAVVEWVPELDRFETITVRHLLNHTSGLPDYYETEALEALGQAGDGQWSVTNADAVALYETWGELEFEPGSRYEYSNPGYEVLGLLVERVSGRSFGDFLADEIFEPLGMDTAVVREGPDVAIPGRAVGYRESAEGWLEDDAHWGNGLMGAGGVYASLEDLQRWDEALNQGELVSEAAYDEIFTPAVLNDGRESPYGFGWNLEDLDGRAAIHHTGSWVGFRTAIAHYPDDDVTIIVLSNATAPAEELRDAIAEMVFGRW